LDDVKFLAKYDHIEGPEDCTADPDHKEEDRKLMR
jgi:hypothetical protein